MGEINISRDADNRWRVSIVVEDVVKNIRGFETLDDARECAFETAAIWGLQLGDLDEA